METARTYVFTAVFAPDELPVAWVLKVAGLLTSVSRHTLRRAVKDMDILRSDARESQ